MGEIHLLYALGRIAQRVDTHCSFYHIVIALLCHSWAGTEQQHTEDFFFHVVCYVVFCCFKTTDMMEETGFCS